MSESVDRQRLTLGLLAPPQIPESLVEEMRDKLLERLRETDAGVLWEVQVTRDVNAPDVHGEDDMPDFPPTREGAEQALEVVRERGRREDWDLTVCLTDLPFRTGGRVLIADASPNAGVALVSVPALGPVRRPQRVCETIVQLAEEMRARRDDDLREVAPLLGGHLRMIGGMVRANRPWRIVAKLSLMLAAALASAAIALITADVWMLSDALGDVRLAAMALASIAVMVIWLIVVHHLWERPSDRAGREQASLFNLVTAVSLALGVACLYACLFVLTLIAGAVLIESGVMEKTLGHAVGIGTYLTLAWLVSSLATIGGALGSGLERELDIREAAYSYHPERDPTRGGD
jgi:hypothetical protein